MQIVHITKLISQEKVAEANKTAIPPNTPKNFEQEWGGKTLPEVIEEYVAMWAECQANPEKKIAEGEISYTTILVTMVTLLVTTHHLHFCST